MSAKKSLIKKLIIIVICIMVWGLGVLFFYNQYSNHNSSVAIKFQPKYGRAVTKNISDGNSFIEEKQVHLILLTIACAVPAVIALTKKRKNAK